MRKLFILTNLGKPNEIQKDFNYINFGQWCLKNKKFDNINNFQSLEYHWNDRDKLFLDFKELTTFYEIMLIKLTEILNEVHKVNFSTRYWRIIVGPWLGNFIQIVFDRWEIVRSAINKLDSTESGLFFKVKIKHFIANDMKEFDQVSDTEEWNQYIFQLILQERQKKVSPKIINKNLLVKPIKTAKNRTRFKIICNKISNFVFGENDVFIISSYLPLKELIKIQLKLGQFPSFWFRTPLPNFEVDSKFRNWKIIDDNFQNLFHKFIFKILPKHMPKSYLEGYKETKRLTFKYYPQRASAIFDCNSWNTDDLTKNWIGTQTENGTKFLIGQHGGNYGQSKWNFSEDHQFLICDKFLTWGWKSNSKTIPLGIHKLFGLKSVKPSKDGKGLIAQMGLPIFSQNLYSVPMGFGQWLEYFNDQYKFVDKLPQKIKKKFVIRLYPNDGGLNQKHRWRQMFPKMKLDEGKTNFFTTLSHSRIFVASYNATTYLETLSMNFPTIMFWNPNYWELKPEVEANFKQLKNVGVFHNSPESAAKKLIDVWDKVDTWWFSKDVQNSVKNFCDTFCHYPQNHTIKLSNILKQ